MTILLWIYIFFLGAALGSFALVVADRWGTKRSWRKGRSQCDACKKQLTAVDLIPLLSWVLNRGKCRQCGETIAKRYPLVELFSGVSLLAVLTLFPYELIMSGDVSLVVLLLYLLWLVIHTLCVVLILIDIRKMIMPYAYLIPLIAVSVVYRVVILSDSTLAHPSRTSLIIGVLLGGGVFAALWLLSRGKWIGDSDILLGIAIAFVVGGAVEVWIAFVSASVIGLLTSFAIALVKKQKLRGMKIPFGPFLIAGMVVSMLFASDFINLYIDTLFSY